MSRTPTSSNLAQEVLELVLTNLAEGKSEDEAVIELGKANENDDLYLTAIEFIKPSSVESLNWAFDRESLTSDKSC